MRNMIWLLFLTPFAVSCETPGDVAEQADRTPGVSVCITETDPVSCPTIEIRNNTKSELRVWRDGNSWGWWNLSFCVVMDDGRVIHIQRSKSAAFTTNGPVCEAIEPGSEATRNEIDLHDEWWELPKDFRYDRVQYMSAIYFVSPSKESKEKGVWTGLMVSPWVPVQTR
jgi:hypothetical protein